MTRMDFWLQLRFSVVQLKISFYITTSTSYISLVSSKLDEISRWKRYVRQYEQRILLAANGKSKCIQLWRVATNAVNVSSSINWPTYNSFWRMAQRDFARDGHPGTTSEDIECIQFVLVMMPLHLELTRAVKKSKEVSSHIVSLFMDTWIIPHGTSRHVDKSRDTVLQ